MVGLETPVKISVYMLDNYAQRGTTKANSTLKSESPKCHLLALKPPARFCFCALVADNGPDGERRIHRPI